MRLFGAWAAPGEFPAAVLPDAVRQASAQGGRPALVPGGEPLPVVLLLEMDVRGLGGGGSAGQPGGGGTGPPPTGAVEAKLDGGDSKVLTGLPVAAGTAVAAISLSANNPPLSLALATNPGGLFAIAGTSLTVAREVTSADNGLFDVVIAGTDALGQAFTDTVQVLVSGAVPPPPPPPGASVLLAGAGSRTFSALPLAAGASLGAVTLSANNPPQSIAISSNPGGLFALAGGALTVTTQVTSALNGTWSVGFAGTDAIGVAFADTVEVTFAGTVTQPPPGGGFPAGPHIRLVSRNGVCTVPSQDGVSATVRLATPVWPNTGILGVSVHNTAATLSKSPYWGFNPGYLAVQGAFPGELAVTRTLDSPDWGTVGTGVFAELTSGGFLMLNVTLEVAPSAIGPVPAPRPVDTTPRVFFEDFLPTYGPGALYHTSGNVVNTGNSTLLLDGLGMAMTPPNFQRQRTPFDGFGNGLFEFRFRYYGAGQGDGTGPAIILWPADDVWPGTEIDLGELFQAGTDGTASGQGFFYMANHWADPVTGENRDRLHGVPEPFDHTQWHTTAAVLTNDRVVFLMDGVVVAVDTDHVAPDYANGGVNHTVGFLNASTDTKVEVDWVRWTPLALLTSIPGG